MICLKLFLYKKILDREREVKKKYYIIKKYGKVYVPFG